MNRDRLTVLAGNVEKSMQILAISIRHGDKAIIIRNKREAVRIATKKMMSYKGE